MGLSEQALVGIACVLSQGKSPEMESVAAQFTLKDKAALTRVIESGFCESPEFQKMLTIDTGNQSFHFKNGDVVATQCVGCKE